MRVLVLEEAALVRDRLVAMLSEALGVEVLGDAPRACSSAIAGARAPDVVIFDVHDELAGGLDLIGEIKRSDRATLVVVLTNHVEEHHRRRCLRRGADFFLDKSKQLSRVVDVLRAHRARLAAPAERGSL